MIVSNHNGKFQLFTQHNHSILSGQFVPYWSDDLFIGHEWFKDVQIAVREHDRAWIPLDQEPIWNNEKEVPHSFMDYPTEPKLDAYTNGVAEVEQLSSYAGYLNSLHFLSFYKQKSTDSNISQFISREIDRQNKLIKELSLEGLDEQIEFHFNLLQFCDDLSLYICLNKPGTSKEDEIFMFKEGFRQSFTGLSQQMNAHWIKEDVIRVRPFPFIAPFKVSVPHVELTRRDIQQFGLNDAYQRANEQVRNVIISD